MECVKDFWFLHVFLSVDMMSKFFVRSGPATRDTIALEQHCHMMSSEFAK